MRTATILLGIIPCLAWAIDAPVLDISATTDGDSVYVSLHWNSVPGAVKYSAFYQAQLNEAPSLLGFTNTSSFDIAIPAGWNWQHQPDVAAYFSVVAESLSAIGDLIQIPNGTFMMGQNGVAVPEHQVTLTHDFLLSRTEVTNSQYVSALQWAYDLEIVTVNNNTVFSHGQALLYMEDNSCMIGFEGDNFYLETVHIGEYTNTSSAEHPVTNVTWYGAACYCDWISIQHGLAPFYNGNWALIPYEYNPYESLGYRLPTEAEWEFSAQYNDERTYPWGSAIPTCDLANIELSPTCVGGTSPVGTYQSGASGLGLLDMAGNVNEWCNDWFGPYYGDNQIDPVGPFGGYARASKGGCWGDSEVGQKCARRHDPAPTEHMGIQGFRLCKSLH